MYRTLRDAVVLDWTISLADKDKMKTCAVTYLAKEANESTTIDPFMPRTRTFLLEHLLTGQVSSFLDASISNARGAVGGERKILTVLIVQELAPTAHSCRKGKCLDIQSIY